MYKDYLESVIKRARKDLKASNIYEIKESKKGDKITIDGKNYFGSIVSVDIYYKGCLIAEYNIEKKELYKLVSSNNIDVLERACDLYNGFVGYNKYEVKYKELGKYLRYKEDLDEGLSDKECWEMYKSGGE